METKALFATISYSPGIYTVHFQHDHDKTGSHRATREGHSVETITKYPNLPVLDFSKAKYEDVIKHIHWDKYITDWEKPSIFFPRPEYTTEEFLRISNEEYNIPIFSSDDYKEQQQ